MATYNRGKLLRLAKAGKLMIVSSYSFTDGYSNGNDFSTEKMPVEVRSEVNKGIYKEGVCYVREDEFKGYGHASLNTNGTIHLHVHSNKSYDFKIIG